MSIAGKRALVTGASGGLGADFARELARRGAHVVVVARRSQQLESLAAELRGAYGVDVEVVTADLSSPDAAREVYESVSALGKPVDVLINNAGLGLYGRSLEIPWEKERAMLQVDVVALAGLAKLFLPAMVQRRFGFVLNLSSIGAYQPSPYYASYSAAKTFVLYYSAALNYELRGTGVSVTAISPGITATDFLTVSGQQATRYQRIAMMTSPQVAKIGIDAMLARKASVVPGVGNALTALTSRLSPHALTMRITELVMKSNVPQH